MYLLSHRSLLHSEKYAQFLFSDWYVLSVIPYLLCTVLGSSLHLQSRDLEINLNSVFAKTILRGQTYESIRLGSYIFVSRFVVVLSFSAKKITCSCRLAYVLQDIKN